MKHLSIALVLKYLICLNPKFPLIVQYLTEIMI